MFKAPATGAVFAIEVPYQDDLAGRMILPALCASAVSYTTLSALRSTSPLLPIGGSAPFKLADLGGAVIVGLVCGIAARLFAWGLRAPSGSDAGRLLVRVLTAAAILAVLAVVSGPRSRARRSRWGLGTRRSVGHSINTRASPPSAPS